MRLYPEAGTERSGGRAPVPHHVRLDRAALSAAVAEAQRNGTPAITFDVAPGVRVQSEAVWTDRRGPGQLTWSGTVAGDPLGHVLLTVEGEAAVGHITTGGRAYAVGYAGGGRQVVYEVDPASLGTPCRVVAGEDGRGAIGEAGRRVERSGLRGATDTVRVMLLYTSDVRATLGEAGVAALLQGSVDSANDVLIRTEVPGRVALAHAAEVPTPPADLVEDAVDALYYLRTWDDGVLDEVHRWRLEHEASLVSMVVGLPGYCGAAYVPRVLERGTVLRNGFSVVHRGCAVSNASFAHEVGHNLGLLHDPHVNLGAGPYDFGHGYVNLAGAPGEQFRTVMAYAAECEQNGAECPRVPYYSSASLTLGGHPLGEPVQSDAARVLAMSMPFVAALKLNLPVEAPDIRVVTLEDEPVEIVPSRDAVQLRIAIPPEHGGVDVESDTVLVYRPASNYYGADSLVYEVANDLGAWYLGVIHIEVEPVIDPPYRVAVLAPTGEDIDLNDVEGDIEVQWTEMRRHPDLPEGAVLEATWHVQTSYYETRTFDIHAGDTTRMQVSPAVIDAMLAEAGVAPGRGQLVTHWVSVSDGERSTPSYLRHTDVRRLEEAVIPGDDGGDDEPLPLTPVLQAAYPNPVREVFAVEIGVPAEGVAQVTFYDLMGRPARATERSLEAGSNRLQFDLRALPAGVYFYRIDVASATFRGRVTVL